MKKFLSILIGALAAIPIVGWIGLYVKPKPFPAYPERTPPLETVALPENLPAPVARYYEATIGNRIPVIKSAIITGRATVRFMGIRFPARFRFTHVAGQDYRHYIEATIFGYPILKVDEHYLDGRSRLELPFGVVENEPKVDMAANLGLWAESIWLPSIFVTDPRARWEEIDDNTARLVVPFGEDEDTFTATFDSQTGLLVRLEAMRWKEVTDEAKILWLNETLDWNVFHGINIPSTGSVTWMDEGSPWAVFTVEDVVYNADVSEYVRAKGY